MNTSQKLIFMFVALSFLPIFADNQTERSSLILNGYDAVSYQTENTAQKGSPNFTANHEDRVYQFVSAENLALFLDNPTKYVPEYGGYYAYGMAFGAKVPVDGKAFQIVDGKLYVNKNQSVYQLWKQDIPGNIARANAQWSRL